ncbi:MAG: class I SAM-dependent methyltransferase [Lewinellaceae bacterium]|nr:class I SAM-dependent methyltransferase [Lewinellaceae bacterium]
MKRILLYILLFGRFLRYYFSARTRHNLHGPFAYALTEAIIEDTRTFYAFGIIEQLRKKLLRDKQTIRVTDYGAGSKVAAGPLRRISSLARYSAISPATGRMLFRLVHFTKPRRMLELGASLGISTAYQGAAALGASFITIEGCPETARYASQNFQRLGLANIHLLNGQFQHLLPQALQHLQRLDYLYLDGDHRAGASLSYFQQCLPYAHSDSVFVIADIHWSREMEDAWLEMQRHPAVTLSVDLFHIGLLFFRKEQRQEKHYAIIRARYKPWLAGLSGKS